jgi:predicted DNA-binding transcriptional regulator YafY
MDKFYRQWLMLKKIPTFPRKIGAADIVKELEDAGDEISLRTVQRDLKKLAASEFFPLVYDDKTIPYGWSWSKEGTIFSLPSMEPHTALTFLMADRYLSRMFPKAARESLRPYVDNAGRILDKLSNAKLRSWPRKVRVAPRNFQLQPPQFKEGILESVFEAVLTEHKIALRYWRRGETQSKDYPDINPLGLVFVDNLIYLVCTIGQHDNPLQFLLHRMESATILPDKANIPTDFTLKRYLDKGEFNYPTGEGKIRLKALFDKEEAVYLFETRFPGELTLEETDDDKVLLEAEIEASNHLRRWLLSFGDCVEILEPESLREEFREMANNLRKIYKR